MEFKIIRVRLRGRPRRRVFINGRPQLREDERFKMTYEQFIARVIAEDHDIRVDVEPQMRDMTPTQRYRVLEEEGRARFFRRPV